MTDSIEPDEYPQFEYVPRPGYRLVLKPAPPYPEDKYSVIKDKRMQWEWERCDS